MGRTGIPGRHAPDAARVRQQPGSGTSNWEECQPWRMELTSTELDVAYGLEGDVFTCQIHQEQPNSFSNLQQHIRRRNPVLSHKLPAFELETHGLI
jgi:hypothetical protein